MLLELSVDERYVAHTHASLGIWAKATGEWYLGDGELLLGESYEAQGWHHYTQPIQIRDGNHGATLVAATDQLVASSGSGGF